MNELVVLQGRVTTATYDEAVNLIRAKITLKGYTAKKITPYPCPVQPWKGVIWWEYQIVCNK